MFDKEGKGHLGLFGVLENKFDGGKAHFIYANNFLHCLGFDTHYEYESKLSYMLYSLGMLPEYSNDGIYKWVEITFRKPIDKIKSVIKEVYRLLRPNGIFFGRTLSDRIDKGKLHRLVYKDNKTENEIFFIETANALQNGRLIGLSEEELQRYCKGAGFNKCLTIMKEPDWKPATDFYFRAEK